MPKCQFTTKYYNYEKRKEVDFTCHEKIEEQEEVEAPSNSRRFCIFHSNNYCLRDKTKHEERPRKIVDRLKQKVSGSITLLCIGFQLHNFSLSDLSITKKFTKPVYFNGSQFFGKADFSGAKFEGRAVFFDAHFKRGVQLSRSHFQEIVFFSS